MSRQTLAINATIGYTDSGYRDLINSRLPDNQRVEVISAHRTPLRELVSRTVGLFREDGTLISSGSDLNTVNLDAFAPPNWSERFNHENETVTKMVDLFSFLLIMARSGRIDPNQMRALLICFSAQVFSISLAMVRYLDEIDLSGLSDFDTFQESSFRANRFWQPQPRPEFPLRVLAQPRIGELPLKDGSTEVFLHGQAIKADCLTAIGSPMGVEVEDSTDDGIVNRYRYGKIRAVQYHPELGKDDFIRMEGRITEDHPVKTALQRAISEKARFREPTLASYLD